MGLQPLLHLPRPSKSVASSPQNTPFIPHGLFNLPATPNLKDGAVAAFVVLHESKHSLRNLFRNTDHSDDDNEHKTEASCLTFDHHDSDNKPPMAFADDLFYNGKLVPFYPPSLKLPPRLQVVGGGGASPRSPRTASSPKSPRKVRGIMVGKDFDPFMAAVERIRKEDTSLKPFHWRQLECSFKESFCRVVDDQWAENEWDLVGGDEGEMKVGRRSDNFYCKLKMKESTCCKKGRQNWKLLSCFVRKKGWDGEKHSW
ncbi:hypothetical protein MA16_Dca021059 [Dendrobium catenatum]|uniref:Uncharacterized protein n=1 Tax=Dendrobium catenatum TaxID=906689 RepID=A0A2I0W210_9ASPA|nr:hypothetical protein MA16_Dca021059 [Dendrobium catenatum]